MGEEASQMKMAKFEAFIFHAFAAVQRDRAYNLGALIAYRFATNREKGGICGGLIASRLLTYHGVEAHGNDLELPIERLNVEAMVQHKFISPHGHINFLPYMLTFSRAGRWSSKKSERIVNLPVPSLFWQIKLVTHGG